ncbi:4-hydroxy-tetrahydrodipicolinate reductase [Aquimarina sp. W85]|uniref:4-hydroxy-tetrahydrodipicolinate reductase n=1 Tax=Aquimarina rhodophyticola TaxID=3342246 RepID=UPI00366DE5A0
MKIALLGYGKMGKTIEKIAVERGHSIVLKVGKNDKDYDITSADVAIDFSIPDAAVDNISKCLHASIPIICGTTGWLSQFDNMVALCNKTKGAFIYASNFSLGVNLFFELNKKLAQMMKPLDAYTVGIEEIHHLQKLDAPSGTAITLADDIIANSDKSKWVLDGNNDRSNHSHQTIPIVAKRAPEVPGTHTIHYESEVDTISIKHTAHNRHGFALGAVVAAEWLQNKSGVFTMKDVLGL